MNELLPCEKCGSTNVGFDIGGGIGEGPDADESCTPLCADCGWTINASGDSTRESAVAWWNKRHAAARLGEAARLLRAWVACHPFDAFTDETRAFLAATDTTAPAALPSARGESDTDSTTGGAHD